MLFLILACNSPPQPIQDGPGWLSGPWPSGDIADLTMPETDSDLGTTMVQGWTGQAAMAADGWSHFQPVLFPFEEAWDEPEAVLLDSDGNEHPIDLVFIEQAHGDPFLADNTLVLAPKPQHPLKSGETYTAVVADGLVETSFTVQDSRGALEVLKQAVDEVPVPDAQAWKRVVAMDARQGETPSGNPATVFTVTFEDGSTEVSYLDDSASAPEQSWDLDEGWPMEVWQTSIDTVAMRETAGMPWASPGVGLLTDFNRRDDGWIDLEDLALEAEPMRLVVQIPKDIAPRAVLTWDHGTAGHAYNAVHRINDGDRGDEVAARLAEEGIIVVSRDQPLYGTRYPLIDKGFSGSIGFYNIGNLPAFRDNQRQGAVDNYVLTRWVRSEWDLPVASFGHSLGSVTNNLAMTMTQQDGTEVALQSGTGGFFTFYILETQLLGSSNSAVTTLGPLFGVDDLTDYTPTELLGLLIGLPEEAWPNLDHRHPVANLFQLIMDPSDPLALAPEQSTPQTILFGVDDYQVPNKTTEWLAEALSSPTEVVYCTPAYAYDGHYCTFREDLAMDTWTDFAQGL